MEAVSGRAETSYNTDWFIALEDPSSCFPQSLSCPHPTAGRSPGKLWDFCLQTASILACIKASNKGFHNIPTPSRLQSSSRAPCLNKRCGIFLGNDEATSHKRKEKKFPKCKKASWKTNRTAFLPGQRERIWHLDSSCLAKEPAVQRTGNGSCREKKEADPNGQTWDSALCSEPEAQPNASLDTAQGATGSSPTSSPPHVPSTPNWRVRMQSYFTSTRNTCYWKQLHRDTFSGWQIFWQ